MQPYMTHEQIKLASEAIYHIHIKAVKIGTEESYKTAYDELQGVWIVLHYMYDSLPYLSIAIDNMQRLLKEGMSNESYRKVAKETWTELQGFNY